VLAAGQSLYRDFAWRRTQDPYAVLVSEIMLQQTQTSRVGRYFANWMRQFPSVDALAAAQVADVLHAWQGLGYNRRALALKRLADEVSERYFGVLPDSTSALCALPGIGPATAAGVLCFAYGQPASYLETNVRTVLLHELFPRREGVSDSELLPVVAQLSTRVCERGIAARTWNYALLDYGVFLKKTLPNPSRRSKHYSRQSPYEGSHRQKRARILEAVLATPGACATDYAQACHFGQETTEAVLAELATEGFLLCGDGHWAPR
jgi:A/G-specific adenine glycosylase